MTPDEFAQLTKFLAETPAAVRQLTSNLTESAARWKPSDKEFSAVEHLCHLRDIEQEGYRARIGRILEEEQPLLPDLDGARLAQERSYNKQELNVALDVFTRARLDNLSLIKSLSPEQLGRCGTFENVGPITLEKLLHMMREHDEAHLQELKDLRARLAVAEQV
jgi:hypothetical protein